MTAGLDCERSPPVRSGYRSAESLPWRGVRATGEWTAGEWREAATCAVWASGGLAGEWRVAGRSVRATGAGRARVCRWEAGRDARARRQRAARGSGRKGRRVWRAERATGERVASMVVKRVASMVDRRMVTLMVVKRVAAMTDRMRTASMVGKKTMVATTLGTPVASMVDTTPVATTDTKKVEKTPAARSA